MYFGSIEVLNVHSSGTPVLPAGSKYPVIFNVMVSRYCQKSWVHVAVSLSTLVVLQPKNTQPPGSRPAFWVSVGSWDEFIVSLKTTITLEAISTLVELFSGITCKIPGSESPKA